MFGKNQGDGDDGKASGSLPSVPSADDVSNQLNSLYDFHVRPWIDQATRSMSDLSRDSTNGFDSLLSHIDSQLSSLSQSGPLRSIVGGRSGLIAYPVPSSRQYIDCVDSQKGRSVWTEDGVWRCLLPGASAPDNLKHQFTDYTDFLKYQRKLVRARDADAAADAKLQAQLVAADPLPHGKDPNDTVAFPGGDRPRLVSEEEAKGKRVVSQTSSSESVTLDDGSLETRTQLIKYFDDGTASVKRTSHNAERPKSGGWFW